MVGQFPGWLLKRARDVRAKRIVTILSPKDDTSQCAYLLDLPDGSVEFHASEDGESGVEAATLVFQTRKDVVDFVGRFVGALTGRNSDVLVPGKIE